MRVLIAVGCDQYECPGLDTLYGAENDANDVFDVLVKKGLGDYELDNSRLLLSPSLQEVTAAISDAIFERPVSELTIYFAGHGGVKDSTYFLCLRDTNTDRFSVTGLSMPQIFGLISEAKVSQTNIIVDACQSGGVAQDIASLLNPQVIGKAGSLSLSILAASGADEYAGEEAGHGLCTAAVLEVLRGERVSQTIRPSLDLIEIGKLVSEIMQNEEEQSPVYWGINLYGRSQLCKNPVYYGNPFVSDPVFMATNDPLAQDIIQPAAEKIWLLYRSMIDGFDTEQFFETIEPICEGLKGHPDLAASFLEGLANTFGSRLQQVGAPFEEAQLYACCVCLLMKFIREGAPEDEIARSLIVRFIRDVENSSLTLLDKFQQNEYFLLSGSGFADLYFLPIRIMSILGWVGAAFWAQRKLGIEYILSSDKIKMLIEGLCDRYQGSIASVSDEQAPFYIAFASASDLIDCNDLRETVSGLLFSTMHDAKGNIGAPSLGGADAFRYIDATIKKDYTGIFDILARPVSLLPALLIVYECMGMRDVADRSMRGFDRVNMNLFTPDSYVGFSADLIEKGVNNIFEIGHTIWSCEDMIREWQKICSTMDKDSALSCPSIWVGAVLASLLRPNRQAWFLLA